MTSLSNELKSVLVRRLEQAAPDEVLVIASALCAKETPPAPRPLTITDVRPRFEILDDELALDHTTGLVWTRGFVPGGKRPWKESMDAAGAFTLNGQKFRAPTVAERLGINDYDRCNPAIDTDVFHSEESGWEWTSSIYKPSPSVYRWSVFFDDGDADYSNLSYNGWVRAVRVGQFLGSLGL